MYVVLLNTNLRLTLTINDARKFSFLTGESTKYRGETILIEFVRKIKGNVYFSAFILCNSCSIVLIASK